MSKANIEPTWAAARWFAVFTICTAMLVGAPVVSVFGQETANTPVTGSNDEDADHNDTKNVKKKSLPVIPIPIFITEPAVGYGFGAAVGYFHKPKSDAEADIDDAVPGFTAGTPPTEGTDSIKKRPPTITGVAAGYTENGTWAVGVGHSTSWRDDTIRYVGALAYADIFSTFYFLDVPFDFNLNGGILYQNIRFRLGESDFFLGGKLSYLKADGEFTLGEGAPAGFLERDSNDGGLAFQSVWDTRDNTMTPDSGQLTEIVVWRYDQALGGDYDYWKASFKGLSFHSFGESLVAGFRLEVNAVSGDPPLWSNPWISLRGIPALRYQNELAGAVETELRWNILPRWAVLGFVGMGWTSGDKLIYEDESGIVAGGIGGRWLFRPEDSLWVGVDIATGPEDTYAYIQVGHAW